MKFSFYPLRILYEYVDCLATKNSFLYIINSGNSSILGDCYRDLIILQLTSKRSSSVSMPTRNSFLVEAN